MVLSVMKESIPPELIVDAASEDREVMGMHHKKHLTFGIQFHPESVLTPSGKKLLRNFLKIVSERKHGKGIKP